MEFNLADLWEAVVDAAPDAEAMVCGERRLSFAQADERINRLAHHLQAAGIGPGDHVALYLYNSTEYLEGLPEGPLEAAYEAIARDYGASNDIGRVGLPEEVATMVVLLCSELCSFVVGATVPVDGGTDFF